MLTSSPKLLLNGFIKVATYTNVGSKSHLLERLEKNIPDLDGNSIGQVEGLLLWEAHCSMPAHR